MTTAVDKRPAAARLVAVAAAGHLPTAPTPPQGARPIPLVRINSATTSLSFSNMKEIAFRLHFAKVSALNFVIQSLGT
jgi:hypothetical protein